MGDEWPMEKYGVCQVGQCDQGRIIQHLWWHKSGHGKAKYKRGQCISYVEGQMAMAASSPSVNQGNMNQGNPGSNVDKDELVERVSVLEEMVGKQQEAIKMLQDNIKAIRENKRRSRSPPARFFPQSERRSR